MKCIYHSAFIFFFGQILCEEQDFFLEIADLIRGLGLTILKGVMETQNDKIWARFAVEVIFKKKPFVFPIIVVGTLFIPV